MEEASCPGPSSTGGNITGHREGTFFEKYIISKLPVLISRKDTQGQLFRLIHLIAEKETGNKQGKAEHLPKKWNTRKRDEGKVGFYIILMLIIYQLF